VDADRNAELARISAALVKAIADAHFLTARGDFTADLFELVQHARELHDIALEVLAADPDPGTQAHGLADAIGNELAELEAMLAEQTTPRPLH
jgi:hypothetical protein